MIIIQPKSRPTESLPPTNYETVWSHQTAEIRAIFRQAIRQPVTVSVCKWPRSQKRESVVWTRTGWIAAVAPDGFVFQYVTWHPGSDAEAPMVATPLSHFYAWADLWALDHRVVLHGTWTFAAHPSPDVVVDVADWVSRWIGRGRQALRLSAVTYPVRPAPEGA